MWVLDRTVEGKQLKMQRTRVRFTEDYIFSLKPSIKTPSHRQCVEVQVVGEDVDYGNQER